MRRFISRTCYHNHPPTATRSEEHTSELQSHVNLVCRLLLEKKKKKSKHLNPRSHHQQPFIPRFEKIIHTSSFSNGSLPNFIGSNRCVAHLLFFSSCVARAVS